MLSNLKMSPKTNTLIANEGKTLVYLIPGVVIIVISIPFLFFILPIGILLIIGAISLFTAETGLEIDLNNFKYRRYKSIFNSKSGTWKSFSTPTEFHLILSVESESIRNPYPVGGGGWNNSQNINKSITYDLICIDDLSIRHTLFEFLDYDIAKQMTKRLSNLNQFEVVDHIAIKLQENREKRANRR